MDPQVRAGAPRRAPPEAGRVGRRAASSPRLTDRPGLTPRSSSHIGRTSVEGGRPDCGIIARVDRPPSILRRSPSPCSRSLCLLRPGRGRRHDPRADRQHAPAGPRRRACGHRGRLAGPGRRDADRLSPLLAGMLVFVVSDRRHHVDTRQWRRVLRPFMVRRLFPAPSRPAGSLSSEHGLNVALFVPLGVLIGLIPGPAVRVVALGARDAAGHRMGPVQRPATGSDLPDLGRAGEPDRARDRARPRAGHRVRASLGPAGGVRPGVPMDGNDPRLERALHFASGI